MATGQGAQGATGHSAAGSEAGAHSRANDSNQRTGTTSAAVAAALETAMQIEGATGHLPEDEAVVLPQWHKEKMLKLQMVSCAQLDAWANGDGMRTKAEWDEEIKRQEDMSNALHPGGLDAPVPSKCQTSVEEQHQRAG